ncbi:hypothetical protein KM900_19710 [Bacillus subtilis]|uniref:hypothetical protein n=1 Tax=Bacillus subtilis TaxID=1423 RepID=UPI001C2131C5|nr:hypothetical protein [Bacillus subtilis]MBU8572713.1 hypothetical protein [Bacillus subtilis]MBU8625603.1 hypothetical protein [Bacillus subtilis]
MTNYIEFRVIKIIDEYSLVINGGLNKDVSLGDKIEIYLQGEEIIDPFDGDKKLGTLDFIKDKLEVVELYSNFSVCKKLVKTKVYQPSALQKAFASSNIASTLQTALGGYARTEIKSEKINVGEEDISGRVTGEKTIKIGDYARIAVDEDQDD